MPKTLQLVVPATFEACTDTLIAASLAQNKDQQSRFAREFFQSVLGVSLSLDQSLEAWQQICRRHGQFDGERRIEHFLPRGVAGVFPAFAALARSDYYGIRRIAAPSFHFHNRCFNRDSQPAAVRYFSHQRGQPGGSLRGGPQSDLIGPQSLQRN